MVSTTACGRPLKSAASCPGATHGGFTGLDAGAIWCRAPEKGGPSSEEWTREGLLQGGRVRETRWASTAQHGTGCAGSPRSASALPKTAGQSLQQCSRKAQPGRWGVKKTCFVDALKLCQVEPEMALLNHHGGYRLPEGPCRDFRSP